MILAGDFNATLDHMAGLGVDGGDARRAATTPRARPATRAVGTWPTALPALLGAPIDHVHGDAGTGRSTGSA